MSLSVIFDKSALQSFSIDETVWFDQFLTGVITPLFYIETLADLEKEAKKGRTPEDVVGSLAAKTPSDGAPNTHHQTIILQELAGHPDITMDGRPLVMGGQVKRTPDGKTAVHFDESPEAQALNRWRDGQFEEIEKNMAKDWRKQLSEFDPDYTIGIVKNVLPPDMKISSLSDLKVFIDDFCSKNDKPTLVLLMEILQIPTPGRAMVLNRWEHAKRPAIDKFAPYASHVFKVDLLYYLGVLRGFIDAKRTSNKVDLAYLYYLPFSTVFVSGDNLHARTVPLFLKSNQLYISADELKAALKEIDEHFDSLPEEVKERGVIQFTSYPPSKLDNAVTKIWDLQARADWRKIAEADEKRLLDPDNPPKHSSPEELISSMEESVPVSGRDAQIPSDKVDQMFIKRTIPAHKGKWRMVPQDIIDAGKNDVKN